ncbi:MAG: thioredoxin family protein, partial [Bacteroidota bacterium]
LFPRWLSSLPKSGGWMNNIKVVLGFIELAFGLKFLSVADLTYHWGILDREIFLAIWIVIFFLMGLYLLGKIKFRHDSDVAHVSVPRLALVIVTFSFVVYMIPGMFGAPLKMLSGFIPPQTTHDFDIREIVRDELNTMQIISSSNASQGKYELCDPKPKYSDFLHLPHGLKGYFDYDQGIACAKERNKPVFIDFTGHGCVNCRKMEDQVWAEPEVLKRLRNDYLIITLYTDDKTTLAEEEWVPASESSSGKVIRELGRKLADFQIKRFGQNSQPQYVLLDTNGEKLINETKGYNPDVADFIRFLDAGLKEFEKRHK